MNKQRTMSSPRERNILFLLLSACFLLSCGLISRLEKPTPTPGEKINYCMNDSSELCVVSFGSDDQNNMVINFMSPDVNFPDIRLQAGTGDQFNTYTCQKVTDFPNSIYCIGPRVPLGSALQINIYTDNGTTLLAQGIFVINGLALPTAVLVNSTATQIETPVPTRAKTPTRTPYVFPSSTQRPGGTRTATPRVSPTPTSKTRAPVSPTATESPTYP